jgi:protein-tyrosine phosphatase
MIDISKVTDYLYVGSRVGKEHADELKVLNFNLIISMIGQMSPDEIYTLPPFKTLWIKTYDTFFTPISIKKLLSGVEAALPIIQNKGKVLVFCMQGKRRSVALAAAILISMGHTVEQAIDLLTTARTVADPRRWYIHRQIKAFEKYWQKKNCHGKENKKYSHHY